MVFFVSLLHPLYHSSRYETTDFFLGTLTFSYMGLFSHCTFEEPSLTLWEPLYSSRFATLHYTSHSTANHVYISPSR
jgi:hypothetical protein